MNNQQETWMLIFFGCAYGLLFSFGYWLGNGVHAIESLRIKQQCIGHTSRKD